jgi:hypothetical protein
MALLGRAWLLRTIVAVFTLSLYLWYFPTAMRGVLRSDPPLPEIASHHQSWGALQFNRSVTNYPLRINGVRYWTGLGTHASSTINLIVPPRTKSFSGACGLDDNAGGSGQFSCKIEVNHSEVWNSGTIDGRNRIEYFSIAVKEGESLSLIVAALPQGIDFAHANWVELDFDAGAKK